MTLSSSTTLDDSGYAFLAKQNLKRFFAHFDGGLPKVLRAGDLDFFSSLRILATQMSVLKGFNSIFRSDETSTSSFSPSPTHYRFPVWEALALAWSETNQNDDLFCDGKKASLGKIKETGSSILELIAELISSAKYEAAQEEFFAICKELDGSISDIVVFDATNANLSATTGGLVSLSERFDSKKHFENLQKFASLAISKLEAL